MEPPKYSEPGRTLEQRIRQLLNFGPPEPGVIVLRHPEWKVGFVEDPDHPGRFNFLARGFGAPETGPFDAVDRQAAITWLSSNGSAWLDEMHAAMPEPLRGVEHPELAPDEAVVADSLSGLLAATGDFGLTPPGENSASVDVLHLSDRLYHLRLMLQLALAFQAVEKPAQLWRKVEKQIEADSPGLWTMLHEHFHDPVLADSAVARLLVASAIVDLGVARFVGDSSPERPFRLEPRPRTPIQELAFMIAASTGAIVPPYPVEGVYRCAYHLCGRVFTSNKVGVAGTRRFCTPRHGQSFYAARRMKEKGTGHRKRTTEEKK